MSQKIGVYGSLRAGGSNHHRLRSDGAPAVWEAVVKIPGRLYSLGAYSGAVRPAAGEDGEILIEVYDVDDHIFRSLDAMERAAGYVGIETTAVGADGLERRFIVWYRRTAPGEAARVEGGDWAAFCRDRNQPY